MRVIYGILFCNTEYKYVIFGSEEYHEKTVAQHSEHSSRAVLLAGASVSAPLTANAAELDNFQDFEIDGEHYYYSALDYSRNVLLNPNSTDAEKNLAKPKVGDTLILQVEKDAVGSKGAVLSANFSFPGKFLVLLPQDAGEIGVSRKITDSEERNRIREIVTELLPEGCGAIVRTNGAG